VLLCERWAASYPEVAFVSCHPGWTSTPGVDALGKMADYLAPLRTPWEGAEGIAWLCATDRANLASGEFYLDRKTQTKHIAGPFFSEGTYTKNSPAQVDTMMQQLEEWVRGQRPSSEEQARVCACSKPLEPMDRAIETEKFMGRWHVVGNVPTFVEKGASQCMDDYEYDPETGVISITFTYNLGNKTGKQLSQCATVKNAPVNTEWAFSPKLAGVKLPVNLRYLILDVAEDYSTCVIGLPDRSYLWIMCRENKLTEAQSVLDAGKAKAAYLGYDITQVQAVKF